MQVNHLPSPTASLSESTTVCKYRYFSDRCNYLFSSWINKINDTYLPGWWDYSHASSLFGRNIFKVFGWCVISSINTSWITPRPTIKSPNDTEYFLRNMQKVIGRDEHFPSFHVYYLIYECPIWQHVTLWYSWINGKTEAIVLNLQKYIYIFFCWEIHSIDFSFPGTPFRFLTLDIWNKNSGGHSWKKRGKPIRLLLPPLANDRRHIVVKFV